MLFNRSFYLRSIHTQLKQYRKLNEEVQLSYSVIKDKTQEVQKNMIVLHGLLGNKLNLRGICHSKKISSKRNSYLLEIRNHAASDHHDDFNYKVMSEDIIRFADQQGLDKFTLMGHSLGGKISMTTACRFPDRTDGVIVLDIAPINLLKRNRDVQKFGSFVINTLQFMKGLSDEGIPRKQAIEKAKKHFEGKSQFVFLVDKNLDPKVEEKSKFLVNIDVLATNYNEVFTFDEKLRYYKPSLHMVGERSLQFDFKKYQKVFPNLEKEDVIKIKGAGHWLHFEKPFKVIDHTRKFLDKIDGDI